MPNLLSTTDYALVSGILFLAYLIRGIAGFGSALVAVPLLLFILPFKTVVPLIVALDYIAASSHGVRYRKNICWHDILPLLPFTLTGILIAIYLFKTIDVKLLTLILGSMIMIYAIYSLLPYQPQKKHHRGWAIPAGSLGGLVGTLFGTGGPFYVIYLKLRQLDKTEFRATIAMIFFLDGGARLIALLLSSVYNLRLFFMLLLSLPIMFMAMYIGGHIHTNLSQATFQRIISIILLFSGLGIILK